MKDKIKLLAVISIIALIGFSMTACPADGGGGGSSDSGSDVGTFLNGTWKNANDGFRLDGNNWTFFSTEGDISKGTWKCSPKPDAGISGATLTLTVTHVNQGGWTNLPSQYNSIKTNTAKLAINNAGTQMTISEPTYTNAPVWDALAGTYTKQP